tara:strand:- start:529 stop:1965 length:1437 start_codon:yes stop_codon:yes gene_type:complete
LIRLPSDATIEDLSQADLTNFSRQFAQGLSFSSSDEIEAFMRSVLGDKSYSDNLDQIRAELKKFDEENPEASTAAFFTGILPTLAVTAPAAIARMGVMAGSATIGALGGFTEGFLSGEGARDRTATGITQGALGAVLGPVIAKGTQFAPKLVEFATSLKNKLANVRVDPNTIGSNLGNLRFDNLTPKQQTTQLFIDFIKKARKEGKELTDNQKNFVSDLAQRLDYDYLMKNYDLPMDKKSRMERAKALGFDVDNLFYRGRFSGNNPEELGPTLGKEVYMSKSPFVASTYTDFPTFGEIAELITTKRLNPQVVTIDAKGKNFNVLPVDEMTVSIDGGESKKFTEVFPELIKTPKGTKVNTITTDDIAFYLRNVSQSDGRPRFLDFDNVIDRGGKGGFYDLQENLNFSLGIPKTVGPIRDDDIASRAIDTPQSERVLINNPQSARYTRAMFDPLLRDINNLRFGIPLGALPFIDTGEAPQ